MKQKKTFYTADRNIWRNWLAENFETKSEIWFVFPTKGSKEPSLSYNDAVEEALCFGWIDSTTGHLDDKMASAVSHLERIFVITLAQILNG